MDIIPRYSDVSIIGKENKYNKDSIIQSFKTILLTTKGERIFRPEFGTDLEMLLWEFMSEDTALKIRNAIMDAVFQDDRIILQSISVNPDYENNSYNVSAKILIDDTVVDINEKIKSKKV